MFSKDKKHRILSHSTSLQNEILYSLFFYFSKKIIYIKTLCIMFHNNNAFQCNYTQLIYIQLLCNVVNYLNSISLDAHEIFLKLVIKYLHKVWNFWKLILQFLISRNYLSIQYLAFTLILSSFEFDVFWGHWLPRFSWIWGES